MTSCEIVKRAIEFKRPERIGLICPLLQFSDLCGAFPAAPNSWLPDAPITDEWGCIWERVPTDTTTVGYVKNNPLRSLDRLDEVKWPDARDEGRYEPIEPALAEAGEHYVLSGNIPGLFERMLFLRGVPELLLDMHENPRGVHELADRVLDFSLQVVRELGKRFRGRIHGFMTGEDSGTQQTSFMSLPMWREFLKARYHRLFREIHDAGMHVWLHSCGHVNDLLEEWIECGLDVANLLQPRNLGIEEIGRRYRGRLCFQSCCDIQTTLPFKSEEAVREEVALLLKHWATPDGGFVMADLGDGAHLGVPRENIQAMTEAFIEFGAPGLSLREKLPKTAEASLAG